MSAKKIAPARAITVEDIDKIRWQGENWSKRVTTSQWKQALLNGDDKIVWDGVCYGRIVAKNLGYGVVELKRIKGVL
jgi:hypothetical protein